MHLRSSYPVEHAIDEPIKYFRLETLPLREKTLAYTQQILMEMQHILDYGEIVEPKNLAKDNPPRRIPIHPTT
jgi:hypothetical protein